MAAIAFGKIANDDLYRLSVVSEQTAFRLMMRLYSWANRTPPIPDGSERFGFSLSSVYQIKCKVDNREFFVIFIYPHGMRKQFMVVNVNALDEPELEPSDDMSENDIYDLDN